MPNACQFTLLAHWHLLQSVLRAMRCLLVVVAHVVSLGLVRERLLRQHAGARTPWARTHPRQGTSHTPGVILAFGACTSTDDLLLLQHPRGQCPTHNATLEAYPNVACTAQRATLSGVPFNTMKPFLAFSVAGRRLANLCSRFLGRLLS